VARHLQYIEMNNNKKIGLLALLAVVAISLTLGNVEAKSKYNAKVELNFNDDCWTRTTVIVNDGYQGKKLVQKSFSIDPQSDEANDLWKYLSLKFDGKKVKSGEIDVLVKVYDGGQRVYSDNQFDGFSKNQKTYDFVFNGLRGNC
jgi:hypothetical protein